MEFLQLLMLLLHTFAHVLFLCALPILIQDLADLETEGLFRVSGSGSEVDKLKEALDEGIVR